MCVVLIVTVTSLPSLGEDGLNRLMCMCYAGPTDDDDRGETTASSVQDGLLSQYDDAVAAAAVIESDDAAASIAPTNEAPADEGVPTTTDQSVEGSPAGGVLDAATDSDSDSDDVVAVGDVEVRPELEEQHEEEQMRLLASNRPSMQQMLGAPLRSSLSRCLHLTDLCQPRYSISLARPPPPPSTAGSAPARISSARRRAGWCPARSADRRMCPRR